MRASRFGLFQIAVITGKKPGHAARLSGLSTKIDVLIIVFLFLGAASFAYWSGSKVPTEIRMSSLQPHNVWFQADLTRVYKNMTQRTSNHYRTNVHPLFSISTFPPILILHKLGMSRELAVRLLISATAGLWVMLLYRIFRFLELPSLDATLFSLLTLVSSAALFWMSVPETYLFGSLTILLVLVFSAAAKGNAIPETWQMLLSSASMSMTVTNWMAGIANTAVNNPWKKSVQITINAFFIVVVLWTCQKMLFPSAEFFAVFKEETKYVLLDESGGILDKTKVFFSHAMLMPEVASQDNPLTDDWPQLSIQLAEIGSTGGISMVGAIIWLSLLFYGALTLARDAGRTNFGLVLILTLAGQFLLHLVYGSETFLYSLHWLPLLVILSSYGARTSLRPVVLAGAVVLIGIAASNNVGQFQLVAGNLHLSDAIRKSKTERQLLLDAIRDNPSLSWPRGEGHVILSDPGSALEQKAYHEPGGNLSPGFTSFGVSFEIFDTQGAWIASSNSIAMDEIDQRIDADSRSIVTRTPFYKAAWRTMDGGGWRLDFDPGSVDPILPVVRISSAGPAGGPIRRLRWENNVLTVNQDQVISMTPVPEFVLFQDERQALDLESERASQEWLSEDGFSTALLVLSADQRYTLEITPGAGGDESDKRLWRDRNQVSVSVSGGEFVRSLDAQVFHLTNGLVGAETRPGDPANYPLNWLRDGAYVVVALARAGQIDLAKSLAQEFLESDFFGGFGAEADAPGLAIWALDEVATRVDDVRFTKMLWPHVRRKANLILEMLDAKGTISKPFSGPVVPSVRKRSYGYLSSVARASENGLIQGKMDNHYPIYFVNAVSYLGLKRAAEFADRVGDQGIARYYEMRSASLRTALSDMLENASGTINPRTLIFGLWPSEVVKDDRRYVQLLSEDWDKERDSTGNYVDLPRWTYFNVAKAHQWLLAGDLDRTWETLRWFWSNQVSPGLYTWWEGVRAENSFWLWENARGRTSPSHVTPHYWTAAEMLLLQLDMLAYETDRDGETRIVIGGGFQADMLKAPVSVHKLQMRKGRLDWTWNGEKAIVKWLGRGSPHFVLGQGFPTGSELEVMYLGRDQDRRQHSTEPDPRVSQGPVRVDSGLRGQLIG